MSAAPTLRVEPATAADLPAIHSAYEAGRAIQRAQGFAVWPDFPDASVLAEIAAGNLLRVMDGATTAGVFSVTYEDPAIWGDRERGAHVYLHRIARAPGFAGRGLIDVVLAWARERCRALGRAGVRMDTWADNAALIDYYGRFGFTPVGRVRLAADPRLHPLYHGLELALLEEPCAAMHLVEPDVERLTSYVDALRRGWSPDNMRPEAAPEEIAWIARDADGFLAAQDDREARGPAIRLPDGSIVPRLPGYRRWMWDGEFCGVIGFRWQPGTTDLPPYCLGHIGFSVVPWKRRRGYATRALAELLVDARAERLAFVELTTDVGNVGSQRVIEANGGQVVERFHKPAVYGGGESLRYRIPLGAE
jgi:predicted acetyltransferase/GNAT superfamily N-acetyltransferase